MQSFRQYKQLRTAVQTQLHAGRVLNTETTKSSVLETKHHDPQSSIDISALRPNPTLEKDPDPIVGWESATDPLNPRNWTLTRRSFIFLILWLNVFAADWGNSNDSQANTKISTAFHVSAEAEALSPALYGLGIGIGALFAGPLTETVGRNPIYVFSRCLHVAWMVGVALAPNFGAQCVFRLFAGLSGSILLSIHAASIADIFGPVQRTVAWPVIAMATFCGTAFAPVVGGWIAQADVSWRWTEWVAALLSASTLIPTLLFLPETFSPILLSWRATHLRALTGSDRFQAGLQLQPTILARFKIALARALHMITREPVVVLLGSWLVVVYIVIFGFLQGFTSIFGDTYNFSTGLVGTSFVAIGAGAALWTALIPFYYRAFKRKIGNLHERATNQPRRRSLIHEASMPGTDLPEPEYRLWQALLAAPAFPISLFWLGWTNYATISPWSNLGAVTLLGFSYAGIYVTVYQYLLDTYGIYAGSATAVITCWRYMAAAAINLISRPMYAGLGVHWTMTMLGCLAVVQLPLPVLFYFYGPRLRQRSHFAGQYTKPGNPRDRIGRAALWK